MAPDKVGRRLAAIVAVAAVRCAVEMQRIIAERRATLPGKIAFATASAISTDREVIWAMLETYRANRGGG